MATRPGTVESVVLAIELLRPIPRGRKITARELHQQLCQAGMQRDLRSIQRQLELLSAHFDIERDEREKPYGYRWLEHSNAWVAPNLSAQESLLLQLAEEHLRHLLPTRLMQSMGSFFAQARHNLGPGSNAQLERQWPGKVRVVATSQPLLPPKIADGVMEAVSDALYRNHWLQLDYKNSQGKRSQADVMPLGLAQQGPRLYLVCRFRDYDDNRNLALHRILSASVSTFAFQRPEDFDLKRYDDDGRFGFGKGEHIALSFQITRNAGLQLLESPLSLDQKVVELENGWLQVTATVVDSMLLRRWLTGFGEAVTGITQQPAF